MSKYAILLSMFFFATSHAIDQQRWQARELESIQKRITVIAHIDQKMIYEDTKKYDLNLGRITQLVGEELDKTSTYPSPVVLGIPKACARAKDFTNVNMHYTYKGLSATVRQKISNYLSSFKTCPSSAGGYTIYSFTNLDADDGLHIMSIDQTKNLKVVESDL